MDESVLGRKYKVQCMENVDKYLQVIGRYFLFEKKNKRINYHLFLFLLMADFFSSSY